LDEAAAGSETEEAVTREEKCRLVAEWLGYVAVDCRIEYHGPRCWRFNDQHILRLPDFYSDEAANALLREAIPFLVIRRSNLPHGTGLERWHVGLQAQPKKKIPAWWAESRDVLEGVVEACLKLIESEGR
jgi:hypothetical protein